MTEEEFKKIAIDHGCKVENDGCRIDAWFEELNVALFDSDLQIARAWFTLQNNHDGHIVNGVKGKSIKSPERFTKAFDKFLSEVRTARKEIRMMKIKEL